jgi:hypothetical protein
VPLEETVEAVQLTLTVPKPAVVLAAAAVGALIVPVDALAVPVPGAVQNAQAAPAPSSARRGPTMRMTRRRFISCAPIRSR